MKTENTTPLFKKVGRKYVPVSAFWDCLGNYDQMQVGAFRLMYVYKDGGRRYDYDVEPATASFVAAALIAKHAMCEAITDAARSRPSTPKKYSKKQLAIIEQFRKDMGGGMMPGWWTEASAHEIADAAIKAVEGFKP